MNLFRPLGALRRLLPIRAGAQQRSVSIKTRPPRQTRAAAARPISLLDAFDGLYMPMNATVEPLRPARSAAGVPDWLAAILALPAVFLGLSVLIRAYNSALSSCACLGLALLDRSTCLGRVTCLAPTLSMQLHIACAHDAGIHGMLTRLHSFLLYMLHLQRPCLGALHNGSARRCAQRWSSEVLGILASPYPAGRRVRRIKCNSCAAVRLTLACLCSLARFEHGPHRSDSLGPARPPKRVQ